MVTLVTVFSDGPLSAPRSLVVSVSPSTRSRTVPQNWPQLFLYMTVLWSSGQSSWLQIQRSRVLFPALPDFLSSGDGTVSTQLR
jgi:hypothetical protein